MTIRYVITATMALACISCAGIRVQPFDGTAATMQGVPYVLPMTVFTLNITRRVADCDPTKGGLIPTISASFATKKIPDSAAMFTLSSDGKFDTSDIKIAFDTDGATSGVNTAVASQAGAIITQSVPILAGLATLAATGAPADPHALAKLPPTVVCSPKVVQALADIGRDADAGHPARPGLKDKVAADTAKLADISGRVTLLSNQISTLGKDADATLRKKLAALLQEQHDTQTQLADEQDKLTKALAVVTDTQTIQWPKDGQQWESKDDPGLLGISDETWKRWTEGTNFGDSKKKQFQLFLTLKKVGPWGAVGEKDKPIPAVLADHGIPVRFPMPSVLSICSGAPCGDPSATKVKDFNAQVLQFGLVYGVPATGGIFKSTTFAMTLDSAGAPSSLEVANQTAVVSAATSAAGTALTQLAAIPQTYETAKLNMLTTKNNIATAQATANVNGQLAPLLANNTLLQAQIAQYTAEAALTTAQANENDAAKLAPLQAENAVLQARVAQLAALKALAQATQANNSSTTP